MSDLPSDNDLSSVNQITELLQLYKKNLEEGNELREKLQSMGVNLTQLHAKVQCAADIGSKNTLKDILVYAAKRMYPEKMEISEFMEVVMNSSYNSNSSDPKNVIYQTLRNACIAGLLVKQGKYYKYNGPVN